MNNSGEAIREIYKYFDFDHDKLIVIYDDIDIDFGSIRIRKKSSAGTHNGMKSIIYNLEFDDFPRIKVAVGKKPSYMDLANFVLSGFSKQEAKIIEEEVKFASDAIEMILEEGIEKTMSMFNSKRLVEDNE